MPQIVLHSITDLPPCVAIPGEIVDLTQRFRIAASPMARRTYLFHLKGPFEPGVYQLSLESLGAAPIVSDKVTLHPFSGVTQINFPIVAPVLDDFMIRVHFEAFPMPLAADLAASAEDDGSATASQPDPEIPTEEPSVV